MKKLFTILFIHILSLPGFSQLEQKVIIEHNHG